VLLADLSRMSKGEVERIWLPFVPWLLLSTALLPERWRRAGLALQLATAVLLEVLLFTSW
jgi:methylthioxylose transferase